MHEHKTLQELLREQEGLTWKIRAKRVSAIRRISLVLKDTSKIPEGKKSYFNSLVVRMEKMISKLSYDREDFDHLLWEIEHEVEDLYIDL